MKIIGVDLDDVLLDFNGGFLDFHNSNYGTEYEREHLITFHLENVYGVSREEILQRLHDFYHSEHHKNAVPIAGAAEAIRELAKENEIYIISASPEDLREEIFAWLGKHVGDHFKGIHFIRKGTFDNSFKSKADVCKELKIEVFIDDAMHNAEDIAALGIPVFLLDSPWNQGEVEAPIVRAYSWPEIVAKLAD